MANGGFVADAFGDGDRDSDGDTVVSGSSLCAVDRDEGGVVAHQSVFEGDLGDVRMQIIATIISNRR